MHMEAENGEKQSCGTRRSSRSRVAQALKSEGMVGFALYSVNMWAHEDYLMFDHIMLHHTIVSGRGIATISTHLGLAG